MLRFENVQRYKDKLNIYDWFVMNRKQLISPWECDQTLSTNIKKVPFSSNITVFFPCYCYCAFSQIPARMKTSSTVWFSYCFFFLSSFMAYFVFSSLFTCLFKSREIQTKCLFLVYRMRKLRRLWWGCSQLGIHCDLCWNGQKTVRVEEKCKKKKKSHFLFALPFCSPYRFILFMSMFSLSLVFNRLKIVIFF